MIKILFLTFLLTCPGFAAYSLQEMTLEEKVGQVLMVHFQGEIANNDAARLIQHVHVGGIIYYNWANGLHSPQQILNLSSSLQQLAQHNRLPIPLFISVDQEGGRVTRCKQGFTLFPSNGALGMAGNPTLAEQSAYIMGQELRAVGINFNLAPVVDINSNPRNPVIGDRSFGSSAEIVISFAEHALQGYRRAGILTSLKHFPGHGDVDIDSHQDLPILNKSLQQLWQFELLPFAKLAPQADTIMTAHLLVPALDAHHCATLSKPILDLLRTEMGFKGVIMTDSLVMEGLLKNCTSIDEAALRAFNAGCDVLLLGGKQLTGAHNNLELTVKDVERIHQSLVQAVNRGEITEARLNEAVQRILNLKSSSRFHSESR